MQVSFDDRLLDAASKYDIHFLDIGARNGVADDIVAIGGAVHATCFEPEPTEAKRLQSLSDNRWRSFTVVPTAVGGIDGLAKLYIPKGKEAASLLRHNEGMISEFGYDNLHGSDSVVEIPCSTLDSLVANGRLPKASYIKIDIEGAELDLLKGGLLILPSTVAMRIEVSFLEQRVSQPLMWDVVDWVREHGFEVIDILDIHRWRRRNLAADPYRVNFRMPYSKGRVSQCDIVVARRDDTFSGSDQKVEVILILAALGYFDLCIGIIRNDPLIGELWRQRHGFSLEDALVNESRKAGATVSWSHLRKSLRLLIPALRSAFNSLPFSEPRIPY